MTHGYDAVLEISEAAYQKILSAIFDTADFLMDQVLSSLNVQVPPGSGFDVSVSFDRPAGIPANATDVIDVHVTLGANGSIGSLRFAAGLAVIRLDNKTEILTVDLRNKLWIAEASIFGIAVPADTVRHTLADDVGVLYVLPLPADQDATAPEAIKEIDVKLIDSLNEKVLLARFNTFNKGYSQAKQLEAKFRKVAEEARAKLDKQPLTLENKGRAEMELNAAVFEKYAKDAKVKLILQSLACNEDLLSAVKTLAPAVVAKLKEKAIEIPKMPGRYGGSRLDREKKRIDEKLNLTPVDPEFYQTQVGRKLEKDLGGRAE